MVYGNLLKLSLFGATLIMTGPAEVRAEEILAKGVFSGQSGHKTSGVVSIVKTGQGFEVRLGPGFKLDGAPGPYLGFGNNGKYDASTQFSKLKANSGAQVYKLPAKIEALNFNEIYVWCGPFNVPLGVARLK